MNPPCPVCHGTGVDSVDTSLHCMTCHGTGYTIKVPMDSDKDCAEYAPDVAKEEVGA